MRSIPVIAVLLLATSAYAGESRPRQSGVLLQMDSVECASSRDGAAPAEKQSLLSVSGQKTLGAASCQEYVLQSDRATFHIRPRDEKHAVLLPVGGIALFRLQEDKMLLRAVDLDDKDREYTVVSMTPRENPKAVETPLRKLNHLQ